MSEGDGLRINIIMNYYNMLKMENMKFNNCFSLNGKGRGIIVNAIQNNNVKNINISNITFERYSSSFDTNYFIIYNNLY